MDKLFLGAMFLVLSSWVYLFCIFVGLGFSFRRSFGLRLLDVENLFTSFWLGWALAIFFLQLWHFYFPVDSSVFALISIGGMLGLLSNYKDVSHLIRGRFLKNWFFCFLLLLMALILANRAILPPSNYDSGLYHFNSLRWVRSFPIVPGLVNLEGFIAYNSSYFLYAAMLETGIWAHKSHHLANGLLLLVFLLQILWSGFKFFKSKEKVEFYHIFNILILFPLLKQAFNVNISSPSPDLPIFILGFCLSTHLLAFLENTKSTSKEAGYALFFITTLAVVGITIKLYFFVLGAVTWLLALMVWFIRRNSQYRLSDKKTITWVVAVALTALIPWMIRGVILSGYIAFPIPVGSFPVEWRLSYASIVNIANCVQNWARTLGVQYNKVLENWEWFRPWVIRITRNWIDIRIPLFLTLAGCFLILFYRRYSRDIYKALWLFLLPAVASFIFWFFTAPTIRYLGASFWILGAGTITLSIGCVNGLGRKIKSLFIVYLCIAIYSSFFSILGKDNFEKVLIKERNISKAFRQLHINNNLTIASGENFGFYGKPRADLKTFLTRSGLILYVPERENQCWDAPLPCTPYPDINLRLRQKGNMRSGFIIDPVGEGG